ncbi:beta-ketoacyl-[acyl-carrier-protein] synthase family protein [Pseudomonas costantinii]|uniref:3-oxoacyl-[acyl-carrier-protein] synthase II n=1 Tax=Pseudomonas costantinii TaxID=168469 RepID=A0A1S2V5J8_9PSED|nr:beta-ketoacyl-[acyl-carrier-protein] synthase family protein [Pseudomonas costantinii]OIN53993.1 hypothetical protein BFL40_07330 [Pseudomonas costantinii]SED17404.1 3-oxoacyl-[acyl-carrier-protein] synthase II [Pseudomonas costantinii]
MSTLSVSAPPVVITGMGIFTPLGRSVASVCEAILEGRHSIVPSTNIDAQQLACLASEFISGDTFGLDPVLTASTDRGLWFALKAMEEALANAGLDATRLDSERTAVVVGTSHSGIQHSEKVIKRTLAGAVETLTPNDIYAGLVDHVATIVCRRLGLKGLKATVSSACSSSNTAVGYGRDLLATGQADRVIVIGTDTLSDTIAAGFNSLKVLGKAPAAPFSSPSGISLGEGAGVLILERLEDLGEGELKGRYHAEVLGYALSSDAYHPTAVDENGLGIATAITHALANAGLAAEHIDYISAHGTGTDSNDVPESLAVARLFGSDTAIASVKSSIGHTLGASGVIELIISVACAERGYRAPNNHFTTVRDGCASLNYVHGDQAPGTVNTILCNNYGFGGNNSSLVIAREAGRFARVQRQASAVFVTAYGAHTAYAQTASDWMDLLSTGLAPRQNNDAYSTYLGRAPTPNGEKSSSRRSSPSIQFALQAMDEAIVGYQLEALVGEQRYGTGLVVGLLHGAQRAVEKYMFSVYEEGLRYARSIQFPLTTLNATAGEVAIKFGIKGFNTTLCGPLGSMKLAWDMVRLGRQERIFALSSDEHTPMALQLCDQFGALGRFNGEEMGQGFYLTEGASVTLLESADAVEARNGTKLAQVLAFEVGQEGVGHALSGNGQRLAELGRKALAQSGVAPEEIDLIIGVGQGTEAFLANERNALEALFGNAEPPVTSVAMHLGYSPTAIVAQMVNLGAAVLNGKSCSIADRTKTVWRPGEQRCPNNVTRVLILFTSMTFESAAIVLSKVE